MVLDVTFSFVASDPDKISTDTRIHRAPDCAITWRDDICLTVALSLPITLSEVDKLDVLRRLDQFRQWRSLDEKRFCLVCSKIITGRQIQVEGGTRGNGPLRISCPTERCNSIPMDWVLPTDEILAKVERMVVEEREAAVPSPPLVTGMRGTRPPMVDTTGSHRDCASSRSITRDGRKAVPSNSCGP